MSEAIIFEYLNYLDQMCGFSVRTLRQHKWICTLFREFLFNKQKGLLDAAASDFLDFMDWRSRTVKSVTVSKEISVVRGLYGYLFDFGKISLNPAASLPELIQEPHPESSWLTVEQCFQFLNGFDTSSPLGLRDYTMAALLWSTGLRNSELCALDWRDIDLTEGALRVRKGKGGKQRQIFLNDRIRDDMVRYRTQFDGGPKDPVFYASCKNGSRKEKHARISESRLTEIIREHGKAAGIASPVTPVTFRHYAELGITVMPSPPMPLRAIRISSSSKHSWGTPPPRARRSIFIHP